MNAMGIVLPPFHSSTLRLALGALAVRAVLLADPEPKQPSDTPPTLTTAIAIRNKPVNEAARGLPVSLEGVVTFHTPLGGGFVLQDETDAIWVQQKAGAPDRLRLGDRIAVTGKTDPGGFAPIVTEASITRLGTSELPLEKVVTYDDLASTRFDCHRVRFSGIVRDVRPVTQGLGAPGYAITVVPGSGMRVFVVVPQSEPFQTTDLIDAEVDVTGVCFHTFSNRRQAFAIRIMTLRSADLVIVRPPTPQAELPSEPIAQLLQFSPQRNSSHSVRLQGTVTYQPDPTTLFISDSTGGIMLTLAAEQTVLPGTDVEVRGFVRRGDYNAVLEDAIVVESPLTSERKRPLARTVSALKALNHDAELISVQATLVGTTITNDSTQLILQSEGLLFSANVVQAGVAVPIPSEGSEVMITGINRVAGGNPEKYQRAWVPSGFELLVASPADITLLSHPPRSEAERWTRRIAIIAALLLILMTVYAARSALRLQRQRLARRHAEGEFKAVLAERNRLAREIHDTLAQGFTAIFTQLELIRRKLTPSPQEALNHVGIARDLVRQSLTEARQSIFNLRPRILEDQDLVSALTGLGRHLTADGVKFDCRVTGATRPIAPDIEVDLLRIGQEAVTNAVRHGKPSRVEVLLKFASSTLTLRVVDDGCGFDVEHSKTASTTGGIGLSSIQERARNRAGKVTIQSSRKTGTRLSVEIPLPPPG